MVRVTNYLVFSASLCVLIGLNFYIENLCKIDLKMEKMPNRLRITELLVVVGLIMILLSQFTGLYYTFDEQNCYQRSDGYWICYIVPFISYVLQASVVIQNYRKLNRRIASGLLLFTIIPTSVTFVQFFTYGLSLTNIGIVLMSVVLYLFVLNANSRDCQ